MASGKSGAGTFPEGSRRYVTHWGLRKMGSSPVLAQISAPQGCLRWAQAPKWSGASPLGLAAFPKGLSVRSHFLSSLAPQSSSPLVGTAWPSQQVWYQPVRQRELPPPALTCFPQRCKEPQTLYSRTRAADLVGTGNQNGSWGARKALLPVLVPLTSSHQ